MTSHAPRDIDQCREWADLYRLRGYNPLPSRPDAKRPFVRYARYWDAPGPPPLFELFPTPNVQVMTGARWGLVVLDLDGESAARWHAGRPAPRTWEVLTGGGGRQLWYRTPPGWDRPVPKGVLWRGEGDHQLAERLGDKALAMAPPSIHPRTKQRYRFADAGRSPIRLPLPAVAPAWLLEMPTEGGGPAVDFAPPELSPLPPPSGPSAWRAAEVRQAIPSIIGLVRSWGVRFTGRKSKRGWWECRSIHRPDRNPSAAVNEATGSYHDRGSGLSLGLFDLAAAVGLYADWRDALAGLGEQYLGKGVAA